MPPKRPQISLRLATSSMLALMLMILAIKRFTGAALETDGAVAAGLLFVVAITVSAIVGRIAGPRWVLLLASAAFYFGLITGLIKDFGADLTMFAFLCLAAGLIVGSVHATFQYGLQSNREQLTPAESADQEPAEQAE